MLGGEAGQWQEARNGPQTTCGSVRSVSQSHVKKGPISGTLAFIKSSGFLPPLRLSFLTLNAGEPNSKLILDI